MRRRLRACKPLRLPVLSKIYPARGVHSFHFRAGLFMVGARHLSGLVLPCVISSVGFRHSALRQAR